MIISDCTGNWWKIFKYFILQKKKTSTAGESRTGSLQVSITALQPLTYSAGQHILYSICTIGNTRKIAEYNELFRWKLF